MPGLSSRKRSRTYFNKKMGCPFISDLQLRSQSTMRVMVEMLYYRLS